MASDREARFVQSVFDLRARRPGDSAALRRSLATRPGGDPRVHRIVYPLLQGVDPRDEWRWFLVAGLAALVPRGRSGEGASGDSFGRSLRHLASKEQPGAGGTDRPMPLERRFQVLLDADARELHVHLRALVRRLLRAGVDVDLARLLRDLRWWSHPDRPTQRRWARDFWSLGAEATVPDGWVGREGGAEPEVRKEGGDR